ncbi:cGMP-dependent protein kinase egl-4-like isoform X2 [Brachyhypopomus gauderio]
MGTLRDLQFALQLKIEELRQRDALIDELELELDAKDDLIRRLQEELDRLRLTLSASALFSPMGQPRAPPLRVKRQSVQSTHASIEPTQQSPPASQGMSTESRRVLEAALAGSECLINMGPEVLQVLLDSAHLSVVSQGARLTQEGKEMSQAFVLEEGKLEVFRSGQKVHTIEVGMLFGELALLYKYTCTFTVKEMGPWQKQASYFLVAGRTSFSFQLSRDKHGVPDVACNLSFYPNKRRRASSYREYGRELPLTQTGQTTFIYSVQSMSQPITYVCRCGITLWSVVLLPFSWLVESSGFMKIFTRHVDLCCAFTPGSI